MKYKNKCKRISCKYEWESVLKKPRTCPLCKSYYWNKEATLVELKALRADMEDNISGGN